MSTRVSQAEFPQTTRRTQVYSSPNGRRTFHELIRDDPLSTIGTVSIDVLSASIAVATGIWWVRNGSGANPPLWTLTTFVPILVVWFGIVCFVLALVVLSAAQQDWQVVVAGAMTGLGYGTLMPAAQAIAVSAVPASRRMARAAMGFMVCLLAECRARALGQAVAA